jgi:hypothetical protein
LAGISRQFREAEGFPAGSHGSGRHKDDIVAIAAKSRQLRHQVRQARLGQVAAAGGEGGRSYFDDDAHYALARGPAADRRLE